MRRRFLLCLPLAPALAFAAFQGKGKGKGDAEKSKGNSGGAEVVFRREDVRVIIDYYHPASGLPPGLAKRAGDLPPGLEKQLRRKGTLPPGLQKKLEPFPPALEARLEPLRPGYRRVTLGTWALLIHDATNVVLDIIDLARR